MAKEEIKAALREKEERKKQQKQDADHLAQFASCETNNKTPLRFATDENSLQPASCCRLCRGAFDEDQTGKWGKNLRVF